MATSVLVTGCNGQLGRTLAQAHQAADSESPTSKLNIQFVNRGEMDLTDADSVATCLQKYQPRIIINAAAYTLVDKAEEESASAFCVNAEGVGRIAQWAAESGAHVIHVSTDFVFDGTASAPYEPDNAAAPLGVYGASKLAGEEQLNDCLPERHTIVRTSWLYSQYAPNFVCTILRLCQERDSLNVVDDQIGSPTSTRSLANLLLNHITPQPQNGIYHWSDGGVVSWHEFAVAIQEAALEAGILQVAKPIHPISTAEYPTPAKRPAYSVLSREKTIATFACSQTHWRDELQQVIQLLAAQARE